MTPTTILSQARAEGLTLFWEQPDAIVVRGKKMARTRWLPLIRQHKPELLMLLQSANKQSTRQCATCCHYRRHDWHLHLGNCNAGQPASIAGWWDSDPRDCRHWRANYLNK